MLSTFYETIQPIIEEFKKSITSLESQLALTKAALVHSEHLMRELEIQLVNKQDLNKNQTNYVAKLKARLIVCPRKSQRTIHASKTSRPSARTTGRQTEWWPSKIKEQDAELEAYIKINSLKASREICPSRSTPIWELEEILKIAVDDAKLAIKVYHLDSNQYAQFHSVEEGEATTIFFHKASHVKLSHLTIDVRRPDNG
ncbi:hypothetical protein PtB15_13B294 [Puccinia triticina]|nr:hypothetical protein PtB15_13B294 [Puccinia triticina]